MRHRPAGNLMEGGTIALRGMAVLSVSAAVIFTGGCRRPAHERKYDAVTGVASSIDLDTGDVSMDWRNEETGEVRRLTGRVTQETEIFINGVSARLADVRLGDRVTVVVYGQPEDRKRWIVTRVQIERWESFMRGHLGTTNAADVEEPAGHG